MVSDHRTPGHRRWAPIDILGDQPRATASRLFNYTANWLAPDVN